MSEEPKKRPRKHRVTERAMRRTLVILFTLLVIAVTAVVIYAMKLGPWTPEQDYGKVVRTTQPASEPTTLGQTEAVPETIEPTEHVLSEEERRAQALLETMTTEQKVYQMIFTTPDALTGQYPATVAGAMTEEALASKPVGGLAYFSDNILTAEQITQMVANSQNYSEIPLMICVDEEGGRVSRLSGVGLTNYYDPMATYGASGNAEEVRRIGQELGQALSSAGFNLDFAPVADVVTEPLNTEIGDRSFSSDPETAAKMVAEMVRGLQENGTVSCLKHFPGHGSTKADSHEDRTVSERTLEELRQTELLPFEAGIEAGAGMVMVSHMSLPAVNGDDTPCDLSEKVVTGLLRQELGFTGVIITDSHEMGAITRYYSCGEAALAAVRAGCDVVLMPTDPETAAQALLQAVADGTLSEARINESVLRILTLKYQYGILE